VARFLWREETKKEKKRGKQKTAFLFIRIMDALLQSAATLCHGCCDVGREKGKHWPLEKEGEQKIVAFAADFGFI
jgi:hypothetical protein